MLVDTLHPTGKQNTSEAQFYSNYEWCLNPLLSLREVMERLCEELGRYEYLQEDWQRQECKVNLYMLICSMAFDIEDYLAWRPWILSTLGQGHPHLTSALKPALALINLPRLLQSHLGDRAVVAWAKGWGCCVDRVCEALIDESELTAEHWKGLSAALLDALDCRKLPRHVLMRRVRIPEGYRDQDMAHQDALSLILKFLDSKPDFEKNGEICVIGVRTAGAFFAPLVKACLAARGFPCVTWMSLRPKEPLSHQETKRLRGLANRSAQIFLIDDHPNTGATFLKLCEHLQQAGVPLHRIIILAPGHPVRPHWTLAELTGQGVTITRLEPEEFHKAKLLKPSAVEPLLQAYFEESEGAKLRILESPQVDAINEHLEEARRLSFQVHMKRVFEIELQPASSDRNIPAAVVKRILAKSVGWGWLGYHAYISGVRLNGFVPDVVGLRNGLLFTEWLESSHMDLPPPQSFTGGHWSPPIHVMPDCLPAYVAKRTQTLRLAEDPCFNGDEKKPAFPNRTVVDELIDFFGGIYDSGLISRLKMRVLRGEVQRYASPMPMLVDGQMRPDEWVETLNGIKKVDFEHNNFIRAALKSADPACDLAASVFEFQLSETAEQNLLNEYIRNNGDPMVAQRMLVYKLIYASHAMRLAANRANSRCLRHEREEQNQRYVFARNFLIQQMQIFCAGYMPGILAGEIHPKQAVDPSAWFNRLFLLDLDGVFDRPLLDAGSFPHTTASGPKALALLKAGGFSIAPATGRSVGHVLQFCQNYRLPGGIAEHGAVIVDAISGEENVLIDDEAAMQLARCREAIRELPGVFLDPGYRHTLRAYRYGNRRTVPLQGKEVDHLLARTSCERLTYITGTDETYIVHKGIDKATGLAALKKHLGGFDGLVVAIGDSTPDLPMLTAAQFGYAPANCPSKIREAAIGNPGLRIMDRPYQQGLLAAVRDILGRLGGDTKPALRQAQEIQAEEISRRAHNQPACCPDREVLGRLLQVAERPRLRQILAALNWWAL